MGGKQNLTDWKSVELKHLMAFLQHERVRTAAGRPEARQEPRPTETALSGESVYLEIAALRAFYHFAENEKFLPANSRKIFRCRAGGNVCPRR